jgi:G3E family GTPase
MHLLTISGFLGSGKTTFVVKLAEEATRKGLRVAILVNEVGEIGIDDQLMRQLDLHVWQLLNGCICCSLAKDLPGTLQKIAEEYSPDLVILEPSGAADLQKVLAALVYYRGEPLQSQRNVTILDPLRLEKLMKVLTPLIASQINDADILLINKSDIASKDELMSTEKIVCDLDPHGKVFITCVKNSIDPDLTADLLP